MKELKRSVNTFWSVTLPDFFLPHYENSWEAFKAWIHGYIVLGFILMVAFGYLYLGNYKMPKFEKNVQITSPIVEVQK